MSAAVDLQSYGPCPTKSRRTKADMAGLRAQITSILEADHPQTVRQLFYQLVARGVIDKTEGEYKRTVVRLLTEMRLDDQIPWAWIVDESRRSRVTQTFDSVADALHHTAKYYRRSALQESGAYLEIWCEKEALTGIIYEEASDYDVPVVASKGMSSITQIYSTFTWILKAARAGKQSFIYQLGDHDPTGSLIPKVLDARLGEFCKKYRCPIPPIVERVALTPEQVERFRLPMRPTKRDDNTHAKNFEGDSVELDALPSADLRRMVRECIERHINPADVEVLRAAEDSEREIIRAFAWEARP